MNTKTFTTFTENQVQTKLEKLIELEKQAKAINLQIDIIKDELKQNMDDNGLEKLNGKKWQKSICYMRECRPKDLPGTRKKHLSVSSSPTCETTFCELIRLQNSSKLKTNSKAEKI